WPMAILFAEPVAESCRPIERISLPARICTRATVKLDKTMVGLGAYDVTVTNPEPAGCTSTTPRTLLVVPPPNARVLAPATICHSADGASALLVNGSDFMVVGDKVPFIRIVDTQGGDPVVVPALASN